MVDRRWTWSRRKKRAESTENRIGFTTTERKMNGVKKSRVDEGGKKCELDPVFF